MSLNPEYSPFKPLPTEVTSAKNQPRELDEPINLAQFRESFDRAKIIVRLDRFRPVDIRAALDFVRGKGDSRLNLRETWEILALAAGEGDSTENK